MDPQHLPKEYLNALVYFGEAVVEWLAFGHANPGSIPQYPLATFLSLVLLLSGQRLPKLLLYCPQTGLTMLYAFEAVAAISLSCSQHIQKKT